MRERPPLPPENELEIAELEAIEPPQKLLIITNPVSTNSKRGKRLISDLHTAHPEADIDIYQTSRDGREDNQQRLLDMLQERVDPNNPDSKNLWIVLATGDGTIRDFAEALQYADDAVRNVPILTLAAGNANDVSSMAHSLLGKYAPASAMKRAHVQPVYPLRCTIQYKNKDPEHRVGLGYITFGATAYAAEKIDQNRPPVRHEDTAKKRATFVNKLYRLTREKAIATQSVLSTGLFEVEENGQRRVLFERIFANGNRMAKHFRLPGRLEHRNFHDIQIDRDTFWSTAFNAGRLACGLLKGEEIEGDKAVSFTTHTPTMMQLDGEAFELEAGATITVTTAEHPLHIIRLG